MERKIKGPAQMEQWLESGEYLPEILRDFHDQKDTFKAIHQIVDGNETVQKITWVDAQIYTIDVFLWFMARRGYQLQRSKQPFEFIDFDKTIESAKKERDQAFISLLKKD